jgi:hypothetical protein
VDFVERALIDKGEDMILILAKAADCSTTTVKELLLMYVAERNLQSDELARDSSVTPCRRKRPHARSLILGTAR